LASLSISGVQEGFDRMYNYLNAELDLSKFQEWDVQMIREFEDPSNPGCDG